MPNIKVFISYSSKNNNKKDALSRAINSEDGIEAVVIPDRRRVSSYVNEKIKEGIIECDYFIPILTSQSITSQWVNQEIGFAYALDRKIWPIHERGLALEAFINYYIDLPYSFEPKGKSNLEAAQFRRAYKLLIKDLTLRLKPNDASFNFKEVFPGNWESKFFLNGRNLKKRIEVKNENEWYENGALLFLLEDLVVDKANAKLSFTKVHVKDKSYRIKNSLNILSIGNVYDGHENNSRLGSNIPILYKKVSP